MKVTQNWEDEDFLQQLWFSGWFTKSQLRSNFHKNTNPEPVCFFCSFQGSFLLQMRDLLSLTSIVQHAWVEDCVASVSLLWNVFCSDPSTTCQSLIKVPYLSLAKVQKGKEFSQSHLGVWHVTCSSKSLKTLHRCFVDCTVQKSGTYNLNLLQWLLEEL